MSILIKDTTRVERERIVAESIGNISGSCDGCMAGLADMYQQYIDQVIAKLVIEFRNLELNKEGFVLMHESCDEKAVLGAL